MKKSDLILIVVVLLVAAGIYLFYSAGADEGKGAMVTVDGKEEAFLSLKVDDIIQIETEDGYNVITVQDGEVFLIEADCRDQICVEHKKISKVGETIVCLPHKLVIEVVGDEAVGFDAVVR